MQALLTLCTADRTVSFIKRYRTYILTPLIMLLVIVVAIFILAEARLNTSFLYALF